MISAWLFDVDGVIRHYEPVDAVEDRWGLAPGALATVAFDPERLRRLTTGTLTRRAWVREVGELIGNHDAALDWASDPGRIDHDVLAVVGEIRAGGCPVFLFSNGSDELADELAAHDVVRHVDGLVNSVDLGVAKPDAAAFLAACERVGCGPETAAFVDDSSANVAAAAELGLRAHRFTDVAGLRAFVSDLAR